MQAFSNLQLSRIRTGLAATRLIVYFHSNLGFLGWKLTKTEVNDHPVRADERDQTDPLNAAYLVLDLNWMGHNRFSATLTSGEDEALCTVTVEAHSFWERDSSYVQIQSPTTDTTIPVNSAQEVKIRAGQGKLVQSRIQGLKIHVRFELKTIVQQRLFLLWVNPSSSRPTRLQST